MDPIAVSLIFFVAGSLFFCLGLKILGVEFDIWDVFAACGLSGISTVVFPPYLCGMGSLLVLLASYAFLSGKKIRDFFIPAIGSRLGLLPIFLYFNFRII